MNDLTKLREIAEPPTTHSDDRRGCMRVHIADRRSILAGERYTRNALRSFAKSKGLNLGALRKRDIGWHMAQNGLIDADGFLRDGFPEVSR